MSTNLYFNDETTRIGNSNLYIGNQWSVVSKDVKDNNIEYNLNMSCLEFPKNKNITYKQIKWEDDSKQDIFKDLKEGIAFITEATEKNKKILINCQVGKSRSATMLIAYIMTTKKMAYANALELVKSFRPIICPNKGFEKQLLEYENTLFTE